MTLLIKIWLPELPPPLSACFKNARRAGRVKTARYKHWQTRCLSEIERPENPIRELVSADYMFRRPDKRKRDLGNLEKVTSDILGELGVLEDDSQIVDLRMRWGPITCPAILTVMEINNDRIHKTTSTHL